ncbi:chromosome segregation SMC family protein [Actinobaculum suis]|uniref:Chromosome partition protein Smc n=1 Tax=Actinobaculum suis TaxID=1657 RepID=A0AAW9HSG7_9ACTO|nr:AAA family ATPase [Actinobaculum suis]MDY5154013.1 AAA family ATPase [Actinobaculum suis]
MHLKSLVMRGFKSFATSTTMRFEPGINAIVGPNGSGKSNVVDALAWVMGEQGAKSLRGGQMSDVIFAGTAKRPALGRAEVSLTIDNSDGALPIDYVEVTITRRLFRNGGSEYEINGSPARLLDIQELLSDTGMGREMHVIIGQGRLDQVLTATPEERRGIIEEAAGVLKHRRRKERALRKLEGMKESFTRVEDLSAELRRQLGPLAKQAEAARRAQVIQATERDARARLLADDAAQQAARMQADTVSEAEIRELRAENKQETARVREEVAAAEAAVAKAAPTVAQFTRQWQQVSSLEERSRSLVQLAQERQRSLRAATGSAERGENPEDIRARARKARAEEEELSAQATAAQDVLNAAISQREEAESKEREADSAYAAVNRQIADQRENAARLAGQLNTARTRLEVLTSEKTRVTAEQEAAAQRARAAQKAVAEAEAALAGTNSAETDNSLQQAHEAAAQRLASAKAAEDSARTTLNQARERLASARATAETLAQSLAPADATAWALPHARGLARESVTALPGWEAAAEAALGGAASGVVVNTLADAVDLLRKAHAEKAGHLDITIAAVPGAPENSSADVPENASAKDPADAAASTAAAAGTPASAAASTAAAAGAHTSVPENVLDQALEAAFTATASTIDTEAAIRARDALQFSGPAAAALRAQLAGTALAADLVTARKLVEAGAPRVVTAAGEILEAAHVRGGQGSGAAVLARQARYEEARQEVTETETVVETATQELARAREETASRQAIHTETGEQLASRDSFVAAKTAELGALRQTLAAAQAEENRAVARLEALAQDIAKQSDRVSELENRVATQQNADAVELPPGIELTVFGAGAVASASAEASGTPSSQAPGTSHSSPSQVPQTPEALLAQLETVKQAAAQAARLARQQETEARLAVRTKEERYRAIMGRADALDRSAQAAEERIEREARAAQRRAAAEKSAAQVELWARQALSHAAALVANIDQQRQRAEKEREELDAALTALRSRLDSLNSRGRELDDASHQRELAASQQRLRYEQLGEKSASELGMPLETLVAEYGPHMPVPTAEGEVPYVREEQEKRLAKAQRQLARLGKINPLALEEHAALAERQQYLADQLADLRKTRADLLEIVKDVDTRVETIMTSAIADVSARFVEVFEKLFPGGEGRLVQTAPEDVLTTGIEIEARPPGKRVRRLSLLSGGERSLTAIAFLVAIFMARPSPFYVMDEVEAALDDVNLSRLLQIFSMLKENSQLLVITHQKRTMEIADTIYGISMREDGVSTVVSQRLAEVLPESTSEENATAENQP